CGSRASCSPFFPAGCRGPARRMPALRHGSIFISLLKELRVVIGSRTINISVLTDRLSMKNLIKTVRMRLSYSLFAAALAIALIVSAPSAQPALAQQSFEDRVTLYQALLDLSNPWTVMCIAAHPDDEDGTSLIVMRRKYGAHTVSLFSTFGEGGQNAIGPELYEELGAIRARETMAASQIQGSEPYFLGLVDFGFSKSRDEAFKKWGHDEALRRMVLEIR